MHLMRSIVCIWIYASMH